MAELVDAGDSKSPPERGAGSSPVPGTHQMMYRNVTSPKLNVLGDIKRTAKPS